MNICIYGASSNELDKTFYDEARALGRAIAQGGHTLVFGGGAGGLMGACAQGVKELGGRSIGIAPHFFDEPGILCKDCTEFIFTEDMRQRKQAMEEHAEAFIILPGGIGTFEEFFETLTLKQLGRHSKPMVMLNTMNYYDSMLALLRKAADFGFMSQNCMDIFSLCDSPEEAVRRCMVKEDNKGSIRRLSDYTK
jgi:uncharacterized protein (TIGR00730 family)